MRDPRSGPGGRDSPRAPVPHRWTILPHPGSFRPAGEQRGEARSLELAEADCAKQGKHAEAGRVDGDTVYTCK